MTDDVYFDAPDLQGLDNALNELSLDMRRKPMMRAMRAAMQPVKDAAVANVPKDTRGLEKTIKLSFSATRATRRKTGERDAVAVTKVSAGRTKKNAGSTGHQAIQVEYGTSNRQAKPFLKPAITQHQRDVVKVFAQELGKQIELAALSRGVK